ncbi:MAG: hypothetical protein M0Z59_02070 [Nitrospiraceae bacterium]|nr:hypothetical protein [Nitrospiraceae bacterium]
MRTITLAFTAIMTSALLFFSAPVRAQTEHRIVQGGFIPKLLGTETESFTAGTRDEAAKICDEVARINKKQSCEPRQAAPMMPEDKNIALWYCSCK